MGEKISYKKSKDATSAFNSVKNNITPKTLAKFKVEAKVDYDDSLLRIKAHGKGFEMNFSFDDRSLELDLTLSLILRPLKGKILDMVKRELINVV